ncbi:MAG: hypothetical protein R3275_03965 [Saprospiraceae bacterium]|nr:hypothetical protein [Saprospiraceae bacterium]
MRLSIAFFLFYFLMASCQKEENCNMPGALNPGENADCVFADTVQHALFFKFTGTWCPPCGSEGAITMREALNAHPQAIGIEVHYNDEMKSAVGYKFISHFGIQEFPSFRVNNDEVSSLEEAFERESTIGIYHAHSVSEEVMKVSGSVRALVDLSGPEYHISVYLMEDGYVAPQYATDHSAYPEWTFRNQHYPEYIHKRILRGEAADHIFGRSLHSGAWLKGEVVKFESEIDIPPGVRGELYPVVVIWEKENRRYRFLNASN